MKNLIFVCFILLTSCDKATDNPFCNENYQNINLSNLEQEYGCGDTRYSLELNLENESMYVVIRNKTDYEEKVKGNCHPDVDFNKFDLIVGYTGYNSDSDVDSIWCTQNCSSGNYAINVIIIPSITQNASPMIFDALIPKMHASSKLDILFNTNN